MARLAIGFPAAAHISALASSQNADGGFGLTDEYESDALDTSLALQALVGHGRQQPAKLALERLMKLGGAEGFWGEGETLLTAEALLAISNYSRSFGNSASLDFALARTSDWLVDSQAVDGTWGAESMKIRTTASVLAALAATPQDLLPLSRATDALIALQQPDGTWGEPFATALSVRALRAAYIAIEADITSRLPDPSIVGRDIAAQINTVSVGEAVAVTANVSNKGSAQSTAVAAQFFVDDPSSSSPVAEVAVPDLAENTSVPIQAAVPMTVAQGRHRLYVVLVSASGQDKNLANNSAFTNIFVRTNGSAYGETKDWPRTGRDMQHSGKTPNNLHAGIDPNPIWRVPADGAPIAAHGNVYFGKDSQVNAYNAKTGGLAWRGSTSYSDPNLYRAPQYNRGSIYSAGYGLFAVTNASTGRHIWGAQGSTDQGPIPFGIEVFPQDSAMDSFYSWAQSSAMDCNYVAPVNDITAGFTLLWPNDVLYLNRPCAPRTYGFASDGTRAFLTTGPGYLTAFDPVTGHGTNGEPGTYFYDVKLPQTSKTPSPPLVDSLGQVISAGWEGSVATNGASTETGRGRISAMNPANGNVYWSFATDAKLDGSPVEHKGRIIVVDRSGKVYALNAATGVLEWSWQANGYLAPALDQMAPAGQTLAISRNYLYVPHPDGHVYTIDPRSGVELAATQFPGRPYDMAIDDKNNAIYIRTLDGFVGAYPTRDIPDQCGPDPANAATARRQLMNVSVYTDGSPIPGTAWPHPPSMSADGRYVAFAMNDPAGRTRVYVRDVQLGVTTEEPATEQVGADELRVGALNPVLSADGRYLAYAGPEQDSMNQIYPWLLYVRDRQTGALDLPLKNAAGELFKPGLDVSRNSFGMSGDGQVIAFNSPNGTMTSNDVNGANDVFTIDRATSERTMLSRDVNGNQVPAHSFRASISSDGRFVAFMSDANLVSTQIAPGSYGSFPYVYDRVSSQLTAISLNPAGQLASGSDVSISANGRFATFTSTVPSLIPPGLATFFGTVPADSYQYDLQAGTRKTISLNSQGSRPWVPSSDGAVSSSDGKSVAFSGTSPFAKGDVNGEYAKDVMVRNTQTAKTELISHNPYDISATGESDNASITPSGSRIAFVSSAYDLTPDDSESSRDVFVWREDGWPGTEGETGVSTGGGSCPPDEDPSADRFSDLSVGASDITASNLETGQQGEIKVTVHNGGPATSEATTLQLFDGSSSAGKLIGQPNLPALAAGEEVQLTVPWNPVGSAGPHSLNVAIDPERIVFEGNLSNNESSLVASVVAPQLALSVEANQSTYGADTSATISSTLQNSSLATRELHLVTTLLDSDGDKVTTLHDGNMAIAAGASLAVSDIWNTLDTTAGAYVVHTELRNAAGDVLEQATTPLTISPDVRASLSLQTDALTYGVAGTAQVMAIASSQSRNSDISGLRANVQLKNSANTVIDQWSDETGAIVQSSSIALTHSKALTGLAPGAYRLEGQLTNAAGASFAQSSSDFQIQSSAQTGDGVRGTLTTTPSDPIRTSNVTFGYSLTNSGNADVAGAQVRVRVSDPLSGTTFKTLSAPQTIARNAPSVGSFATIADMPENRDYQVTLHLVLANGTERPLDRKIIRVRAVPFIAGSSFSNAPESRVLVWACDAKDEQAARSALGDKYVKYVPNRATSRYSSQLACALFNGDEETEFAREMRSGNYNQFWLLGRHYPFAFNVCDELSARVIQGDGLVVAGGSPIVDLFSFCGNQSALGTQYAGSLLPGTYNLNFPASSPFVGLNSSVTGSPIKVTTTQATSVGTTTYSTLFGNRTAVTAAYNQFGSGKSVFIASPPSAFVDQARAASVLSKAGKVVASTTNSNRAGGLARLDQFVEGIAPGTPLQIRTQLPAGTGATNLPSDATLAGNLLTLPFSAVGNQRKSRSAWLKLPTAASSVTTNATVFYRDPADGVMKAFGSPMTSTLQISENEQASRDAATAAINAVTGVGLFDLLAYQKIKNDVAAATASTSSSLVIWLRLAALTQDVGILERACWNNRPAARSAIARLITYLQYDYYLATGGG